MISHSLDYYPLHMFIEKSLIALTFVWLPTLGNKFTGELFNDSTSKKPYISFITYFVTGHRMVKILYLSVNLLDAVGASMLLEARTTTVVPLLQFQGCSMCTT